MPVSENTTKKQRVVSLVKEINRPKEDILAFLKSIGMDKVTINSTLEPDMVTRVHNHFKKDIEEQDKHLKKVKDFATKNKIELVEADELTKKEEKEKNKKDEADRIKKFIEEENRKKEEEKKKQELHAILEREKAIKELAEREKRERLEKINEQRKAREAKEIKRKDLSKDKDGSKPEKKSKEEVVKAETESKEKLKTVHPDKSKTHPEKHIERKKDDQKFESKFTEKRVDKPEGTEKKYEKKTYTVKDPSKTDASKAIAKPHSEVRPPRHFDKDKPRFDRKKGKKKVYEKVTIKDLKKEKDKIPSDKPYKPKDAAASKVKITFTNKAPSTGKEKWDKKDKRLKGDSEYEKKKKAKLNKFKAKEVTLKEIEEAIKDTFQKIGDDSGTSARAAARKKKKKERLEQEKKIAEVQESRKNIIQVTEFLSTGELANLMQISPTEIIAKCFQLGNMVTINQRLEKDLIEIIASEFGFQIEFQSEYVEGSLDDFDDSVESLVFRSPVVTVMGHVDHGKTSLLDYVRKANVVEGEAGGITQHIGAYRVKLESGKNITFLDTPGHEAFTAMRARGGQAADLVVLVVAADDSVMPQTVEAINHALAANVPIVIAINKIDKPDSNPERIKQQLAEKNILVEEWGGKYQSVQISAKKGLNIEQLLEKILLEAEILELKANPEREARGVILESKMDKGRGITATVLVQKGTLKIGDVFISGMFSGRVRAMYDERDKRIQKAGPSTPVLVTGFDGQPQAGDTFVVMKDESAVRDIAQKRQQLKREQEFRQIRFATLDDISKQIQEGKQVDLKVIIKADTDGSAEAISDSLLKLATPEVKVNVIHKAVGQITESDILLAEASNAIIIGFNVRPNLNARQLAEKNKIDVRLHNVIYHIIDEVKDALRGMLKPVMKEEISSTIEVRQVFKVPKVGNVAGCYVQDGKITRNTAVRLIRDGLVIFEGKILSLKRLKDDAREVESGYECGIGLDGYNDIKVGDIIEGFKMIETERELIFSNN